MWEKTKKLTDFALVAAFLGFIFTVLVMTYTGPVQKAVEGTKYTFASYKDLSKRFEGILQKNLFQKYEFINLNGGMARYLGMNSWNGVRKLSNGFLTDFAGRGNVTKSSKNVIALSKFLSDRGIPFFYVLAPSKNSIYDVQFAPGYSSDAQQNIVNMIAALNAGGVNTLNMDDWFKENGWHTEDVFFKTDHHWKPEAAIATARCTMELLQEKGLAHYDKEKLQDESYKKEVVKECYLGSWGRRVGKYFGGVDDITVYSPRFKTGYFYAGLPQGRTGWEYSNSLLNKNRVNAKKLFGSDAYSMYLHGTFGHHITYNSTALNKKKVLITGDSFSRPWQCFLATQFQETQGLDFRRYTDGSFAQYVAEMKPDIVIMLVNASAVAGSFYEFGLESYLKQLERTSENTPIQEVGNIEVRAEEKDKNNFAVVCGNLEPNQAYTLTVDGTSLSGAKNMFVQMTLQNLSTNKAIYNRYFEPNSDKRQKWIFTTPAKVEDTYGIYLYAGTKGRTAKINVKAEGIRLRKGVFED